MGRVCQVGSRQVGVQKRHAARGRRPDGFLGGVACRGRSQRPHKGVGHGDHVNVVDVRPIRGGHLVGSIVRRVQAERLALIARPRRATAALIIRGQRRFGTPHRPTARRRRWKGACPM